MLESPCCRRSLHGVSLAAALAFASPAGAADSGQLEEIVVTATRHEESLSRVPLSVTAMTQETLDQKGIRDFTDVVRFTPGVSIDTSGTNAISIRGISSSAGSGTTGIYIDDTPIQMRALGFNPDDTLPKTFDLDRIEVLRGPQGTLFGAGSEGGTVRYIMTQPSLTKESTYVRAEAASTKYGQASYEAGVAHGGPIVENVLGYRASVWYRFDGGWINRVDPTTRATVDANSNRANTVAARLAFVVQPVEGVLITPAVMYQNSRRHDESTYWPAYSNPDAGVINSGNPERNPVPDEYYLPSLKIEADIGRTKLVSNSSYFHRNELTAYQGTVYDLAYFQSLSWPDPTGNNFTVNQCGPAGATSAPPCAWYPLLDGRGVHLPAGFRNFATPNTIANQQRSLTQEVRWQSNDDTSRWKWTVGAFWSLAEEISIEELKDPNGQIVPFWLALFGVDPTAFYGPYYNCPANTSNPGSNTPGLNFPNCDIYYNRNKSHDRQLAGFGEVTYAVTDRLNVTAGGRYAKMSFDFDHYADGLENYGPSPKSASQSETAFTPKLGLAFQADAHNLYYASYAKGFRPGGANPPLIPACSPALIAEGYASGQAPLTYNSDSTQSFEVGTKNSFSNRVRIATSVYYIKWNEIQQNVYTGGACGLQFTDNLGTAVAKGFDMQAEMVLGGGFSFDASVGYTSARYSKNSPRAGLTVAGDAISGEAAVNYSPGTNPPWTVALGPQYAFTVAGHDAFVRADWEYASRNPWPAAVQDPASRQFNPNAFTLPSTKFASVRGGVAFGNTQLSLFVDNLFNTHTITNYAQVQLDANNPSYVANPTLPTSVQQNNYMFRPRTIGITATLRM
jgi:iron complex outermembrane receptor protein